MISIHYSTIPHSTEVATSELASYSIEFSCSNQCLKRVNKIQHRVHHICSVTLGEEHRTLAVVVPLAVAKWSLQATSECVPHLEISQL